MGFYKDKGYLNEDITIFREVKIGEGDFGDILQWNGTVSKGLYQDETTVQFTNTKEETKSTGFFIVQEYIEIKDGSEELLIQGNYSGLQTERPQFARNIVKVEAIRRVNEIKNGLQPTEWKVYVKWKSLLILINYNMK